MNASTHLRRLVASGAPLTLLSACGGGGDDPVTGAIGSAAPTVRGRARGYDVASGRFRLAGTGGRIEPTIVIEGGRNDSCDRATVSVRGRVADGVLMASEVASNPPAGADSARVRGMVGDFVSAAAVRVAGQRVDASEARSEPPGATAASLAPPPTAAA